MENSEGALAAVLPTGVAALLSFPFLQFLCLVNHTSAPVSEPEPGVHCGVHLPSLIARLPSLLSRAVANCLGLPWVLTAPMAPGPYSALWSTPLSCLLPDPLLSSLDLVLKGGP